METAREPACADRERKDIVVAVIVMKVVLKVISARSRNEGNISSSLATRGLYTPADATYDGGNDNTSVKIGDLAN
jgi:hypothetical protein